MKTGVLLVSHGNMAEETLKSAEMIIGNIENATSIAMYSNYSTDITKKIMKDTLKEFSSHEKVIIFADLLGGTPCNLILQEVVNDNDKYELISGFNLGMVIETLSVVNYSGEFEIKNIIESGKDSIINVLKKFNNKL